MCISISNRATTEADVDRSAAAMLAAAGVRAAAGQAGAGS